MFTALGDIAHRRRWTIIIFTLLFVALGVSWGSGVFGLLGSGGYTPPGVEANRTSEILEAEFGHDIGDADALAVYVDETGELTVNDPAFEGALTSTLDALPAEDVLATTSYWSPGLDEETRTALVSHDRHATYAVITLQGENQTERLAAYGRVSENLRAEGLSTYLGGGFTSENQLQALATSDLGTSMAIALPLLLLVLLAAFRSVVAAAVPLVLGVLAILGSLVLLRLLTNVTDISIFALEITTFLGLGLAIDYGLLIVTRYREQVRSHGGDRHAALVATVATAGRTVAFSGLTVMIAMSGLLLFPQPASRSFGLGGLTVVLFNILGATIVLPAVLAALGDRFEALRLPGRLGAERPDSRFWGRLSGAIMHRPVRWLVAAAVVLGVCIAPLGALAPGLTNHRYLPDDNDGQVSLRLINEEFPADGPGSVKVDVAVIGDADPDALDEFVTAAGSLDGATGAEIRRQSPDLAHVTVGFRGEADDPENLRLVEDLRALPVPAGAESVMVGGWGGPALALDSHNATMQALPRVLGFVGVATLVTLFLAFGSLVLPVKAVLVAFVSQAAAFGVLVWGFQEGGLSQILGFTPVGTTDVWTLGLVSVIAFGLVTDYELFIVSRIREEWLATGDNRAAVAAGLQRSGSIITRAAILMLVVTLSLGLMANSLFLATVGIGLSVAVIVDATVARGVMVPAAMGLMSSANWWLPDPLRALHERIGLSESPSRAADPDDEPVERSRVESTVR